MNDHYCGHYTTNDIEGKITECWLVSEEGNFSHMILIVKGAKFLDWFSGCLATAYAVKRMLLKRF